MQTFTGTITKEALLKEIAWHRDQDMIIKGTYSQGSGKSWKGCAVGCSIHSINRLKKKKYATSNHHIYETELGIPEWLARLEDTIFEGLPDEKSTLWPEQFIAAIPQGVDLEPLKYRFCAFILRENIKRVEGLKLDKKLKAEVVSAIRQCLNLHENAIATGEWDESAARSAESAARSAARSAESAESAARSAAWSAWSAARSAAWSAWSAAWSAAYSRYAKELLRLLEEMEKHDL